MDALPPTMQAWQYEKYGEKTVKAAPKLPVPVPTKGQMLLKVVATGLNAGDIKLQTGMAKLFLHLKLPFTPGMDIAGKVVALGEDVSEFALGDLVFANTTPKLAGGLAEYAIVNASMTVKIPEGVTPTDAAGLPVAADTALTCLRKVGITEFNGSYKGRILIINATGGVGTFVVQMAKLAGATVVATAGRRNLELVKGLGADQVYDRESEEGKELSFVQEGEFDIIIYGASVPGLSKLLKGLKPDGKMSVIVLDSSTMWNALRLSVNPFSKKKIVHFIAMNEDRKDLELFAQWVADGKLRVVVDSIVPFAEAPTAWKKVLEGHATGKVIVAGT